MWQMMLSIANHSLTPLKVEPGRWNEISIKGSGFPYQILHQKVMCSLEV